MKGRSMRRCPKRAAWTVIESLAGICLAATLLVGVLAAFSGHVNQLERADRLRAASRDCDELLHGWFADSPATIPADASGVLRADPRVVWRTRLLDDRDVSPLVRVQVVRLTVSVVDSPRQSDELFSLDLVAGVETSSLTP